MPANITDADSFTSPVVVPLSSEAAALGPLVDAYQALANRTRYLYNIVANPGTLAFTVSPFAGTWTTGWTPSDTSLLATSNSAVQKLALDFLPDGAVLKYVRALVTPGANTMSWSIAHRTIAFGTPDAGSNTVIETGSTSGTSLQVIETTVMTETIAKSSGKFYEFTLTANSAAGGSNDTLWGWQIEAVLAGSGAI